FWIYVPRILDLAWPVRSETGFKSSRRPAGGRPVLVGRGGGDLPDFAAGPGLLVPGTRRARRGQSRPADTTGQDGECRLPAVVEGAGQARPPVRQFRPDGRGDRRVLRTRSHGADPRLCRHECGRY